MAKICSIRGTDSEVMRAYKNDTDILGLLKDIANKAFFEYNTTLHEI
jgi:hypothetical protein